MARVMICDDDHEMAGRLAEALRVAGHEATVCRHTMDMLRGAAAGSFDLIALGLDMAGFGRTGAVEALAEVAPRVPLIAMHARPFDVLQAAPHARFSAVLPRPVETRNFMYAVARALSGEDERAPAPRRKSPAPPLRRSVG